MEKLIEFSNAAHLREVSDIYSQVEDSYLFCHIREGSTTLPNLIGSLPMKIGGTMLILLRSGSEVCVEVNLEQYRLRPGSLLLIFPGNVVRTIGDVPVDLDAYALYFDNKFARSININLTSIAIPATLKKPRSVIHLTAEEAELLGRYFLLIHNSTVTDANNQIQKSVATSLTAALFYQMVLFYHRRLPGEIAARSKAPVTGGRRNDYVRDFVRLVHLHYTKERAVSFYASQLFISPKYLSLLIKRATGRSAANWIDEFVIMEAKNMLRFSGKNIQQVAYALNFPTQSSFGKYFKHLTGMSPSEYQKS